MFGLAALRVPAAGRLFLKKMGFALWQAGKYGTISLCFGIEWEAEAVCAARWAETWGNGVCI